jgi:hypothetical protein
MSATTSFDASPLTTPIDRATVRAYVRDLKTQGRYPSRMAGSVVSIVMFAVIGVIFLVVASSIVSTFIRVGMTSGTPLGALFVLGPLVFIAIVVTLLVLFAVRTFGLSGAARWFRLDRFATANGMTFTPVEDDPQLPGMIFGKGSARRATDLVHGDRPRFVEFANYRYTTGSGKEQTTHRWGYVAIKLDNPLPNIVLDAKSNNSLFGSNLPETFDRAQRLSLEGDFDQHFTLYCPDGYQRDALYLFTPDIMARFVDNAAALDVEIVDDWLFLYAQRDLSTLDPATWAWLFSVVGALLDKLAQWGRWRDERLETDAAAHAAPAGVPGPAAGAAASAPFAAPAALLRPPPGVAPEGRRLRQRVPAAAIVVVVAFVAIWAWFFFGR